LPKFVGIFTPDRLISVHSNDRDYHKLTCSYPVEHTTSSAKLEDPKSIFEIYFPKGVIDSALAISERVAQRQNVVFHGHSTRGWDRGVQPQALAQNHVEIW
jgi:hypothetical protein